MIHATTITKTKVAKVRTKLKTICSADIHSCYSTMTVSLKCQIQWFVCSTSCMVDLYPLHKTKVSLSTYCHCLGFIMPWVYYSITCLQWKTSQHCNLCYTIK